ncbi:DUF5983 family protein [Faunimonas sp. B44]|uniref:DUF5983 family protein n=1 Tax=Faunimonas sp. B44 TaxID=3461493 RepID=UPI0040445A5F
MTVRNFLDLSTGHLTRRTRDWLENDAPISLAKTEYGWFLYAPEDRITWYPQDLWACLQKAREMGCCYALFDCDAERVDYLPYYHDD